MASIRPILPTPMGDDDAVSTFLVSSREAEDKAALDWLNGTPTGQTVDANQTPNPVTNNTTGGTGNIDIDALVPGSPSDPNPSIATGTPAADPELSPEDEEAGLLSTAADWAGSILSGAGAVGKDILRGGTEALPQAFGGVVDALGEMDQFMQQVLPLGGVRLWDDEGNFSPELQSSEQILDAHKAEETLFSAMTTEEADSVTGGFIRSTAQFLTGFIPGLQVSKAAGIGNLGKIAMGMSAGAIADAVVFDPNEDRLSTYLNQVPALEAVVPDYLASNDEDQSHWEGRLKNAIEGAGIGLAADGLMTAFKYYKAQRNAKAAERAANPKTATDLAAADALAQSAKDELTNDIPETALAPLGDAAPDAPLFFTPKADVEATEAFKRVGEAKERIAKANKDAEVLAEITFARDTFSASPRRKDAARDPLDEMIDEVRSGSVSQNKGPKRPVATIVKSLGGIDPTSSLAADLRSRGITPRTSPGLFKKGGRGALDNIPASEHEIFQGRATPDANGYIDQQAFIDGLEAEIKGEPWRTAEAQAEFDEFLKPVADFEQHLDRLGIDPRKMDNEAIKKRLQEIEDSAKLASRDDERTGLFEAPRTLEDIEREAAEEAAGQAAANKPALSLVRVGSDTSYQGGHTAPKPENSKDISDVTGAWPDDFYSRDGLLYYGDGFSYDKKAKKIIDGLRNKPDGDVTIYRAVPVDAPDEINAGDWITITKEYADDHGDGVLNGEYKIISKIVKASEIYTDGNSIHEWGYGPAQKSDGAVKGDSDDFFNHIVNSDGEVIGDFNGTIRGSVLHVDQLRLADDVTGTLGSLETRQLLQRGFDNPRVDAMTLPYAIAKKAGYTGKQTGGAVTLTKKQFDAILDRPPEQKVFINYARINAADDVKEAIRSLAELDADAINAKRRGTVTNAETLKASDQEYKDIEDLLGRAPGPMSAAEAVAARKLLTASGEQLVQLAKIAQSGTASPADLYNFRRAMSVHAALQSEVIAARTETARALQSWAMPVGSDKLRGSQISELLMHSKDVGQLAKAVASLADNPTAINKIVEKTTAGKIGDALHQMWINNLLSGPKTHMVNAISNSMVALYAIPERMLAAGISRAFYNGEIQMGEGVAQAYGLVKGTRDIVRSMAKLKGFSEDENLKDIFNNFVQIDGTQHNAISATAFGVDPAGNMAKAIDFAGKAINIPGSALNASDFIFKTLNYRSELQALAYRQASSEGLEGEDFAKRVVDILADPPEHIKMDAVDTALVNTFTNNLSGAARQAMGGIAKTKYVGPVFRFVMPFVKTPANILKFSLARTPLAYAHSATIADIRAGGARAAQAHARIALGTMMAMTAADLAFDGVITGAGPLGNNDPDGTGVRNTRRAAGGPPPYSVKIGGQWYAYNRLDPIGMLLGFGADFAEVSMSADEADSDELAAAGVVSIMQNLASKSYLSGLFDFMSAIDPSNPSSNVGKYLSYQAGGLVPYSAFMRTVAQSVDPVMRDTNSVVLDDEGEQAKILSFLDSMFNRVKTNIPGLSDSLPPLRDIWGEPRTRESGLGKAYDIMSPIQSSKENNDPATKMIVDNRISLSAVPRRIDGVTLKPEEYDFFSEMAGKLFRQRMDQIIDKPFLNRLSDGPEGGKSDFVKRMLSETRQQAKGLMMKEFPELRDRWRNKKIEEKRSKLN